MMETRKRDRNPRRDGNNNAPQPLLVNHLGQPLKECIAVLFDLLAEAIVGDEVNTHESVLLGDGDIAPVGDEVHGFGHSKFYI